MSYILDALRRAESERDRGAVPNIHAQPVPMTSLGRSTGRASLAPWIVAGAALLLLAVLAWRLLGRGDALPAPSVTPAAPTPQQQTQAAAPAPQPAPAAAPAPMTTPAPMASALPAPSPAPERSLPPVAAAPAPARAPAPVVAQRAPLRPAPAPSMQDSAATERDTAAGATEPPRAAATKPTAQGGGVIYNRNDLPADIQRQLPNLAVGGATYSQDPASRMLILNGQVFHEGDPLGPDLTLEQIQLKAAVFRFKGYRYRVAF